MSMNQSDDSRFSGTDLAFRNHGILRFVNLITKSCLTTDPLDRSSVLDTKILEEETTGVGNRGAPRSGEAFTTFFT